MMAKLIFNGTDQYATMPDYTTLGNPDVYREITYETDNEDGNIIGTTEPITEFGRVGSNYHSGSLGNLAITDSSPIQNTSVVKGDGVRYLSLPRVPLNIPSSNEFTLEMDMIFQGAGTTFTLAEGGVQSSVVFQANGDISITDEGGNVYTLVAALDGIADGQHIALRLSQVAEVDLTTAITCSIDGTVTSLIDGGLIQDSCWIDRVYLQAGMAIQKLYVYCVNSWVYKLDEGVGVVAINSDQETHNMTFLTNVQLNSYDLTSEVPTIPPEAPNLIFLSNFSTGAIQPASQNPDGWTIQPPPNTDKGQLADDISIVSSPSRNGNPSVKMKLTRSDWPIPNLGARCQLLKPISNMRIEYDKEYWAGFSIWLPSGTTSWNKDLMPGTMNAIFQQVHGTAGSNNSPPLHIGLKSTGFAFETRYGNMSPSGSGLTSVDIWTAPDLPRNQWVDIVLNWKLHLTNGFAKCWINNSSQSNPTASYTGPTTYGGADGSFPSEPSDGYCTHMIYSRKYDDYNTPQVAPEFLMYQAEIRYASGSNGFNSVYPGNF